MAAGASAPAVFSFCVVSRRGPTTPKTTMMAPTRTPHLPSFSSGTSGNVFSASRVATASVFFSASDSFQ
jgi:hypothetical protein